MKLGKSTLNISKLGLGCMAMSEFYGPSMQESDAIDLINNAYSLGVNFFDTADMYGCGDNEILVGKAIKKLIETGVNRDQVVVATKCGIVRERNNVFDLAIDNSYSYIYSACDASLARLGDIDHIDLFYIHRMANKGEQIDEAMKAMAELLAAGKIKAVGLSEANAATIEQANQALIHYSQGTHQLAAIQSEYSLMTRVVEHNNVLKVCRDLGITFVAYSPLSRALLTGNLSSIEQLDKDDARRQLPRFQREHFETNKKISEKLSLLAKKKNCAPAQMALAWIMTHPNVVPLFGTTKRQNLISNINAANLHLTNEEITALNALPQAKGYRYDSEGMKMFGFDDEL